MNKYELLEDMENDMLTLVGRSEIPTEVKKILENYCNKLREIVSKYNSHPENILEYIDMNYGYIESILKKVNNEKINMIASDVMHKCRVMEQKLIENEEEKTEQNIEDFRNIICGKNIKTTDAILESVSDYIKDVANKAANILEHRGYSDYIIDKQGNEINQLLAKIQSLKNQEDIFQNLEKSDKDLLDKVLKQYENYQQNFKNKTSNEKNNESNKGKSFREELRNGVPDLEEQKDNSINFIKEQEEKNQNQDKKIIALDDSIII